VIHMFAFLIFPDLSTMAVVDQFIAAPFQLGTLTRFVLKIDIDDAIDICTPLLDVIEVHPKEISEFIEQLIAAEDALGSEKVFWNLWQTIADTVLHASWTQRLNERDSDRVKLLNTLFLGLGFWKENIRHWQRLEGNASRIDRFFEALPPIPVVFNSYSRFLYQIGDKSLPNSFAIISRKLQQGDTMVLLSGKNTVFYLESILRRYVYSRPALLKSNTGIRDAVLQLLDALVENGSSAAYRMRDDFVTPITP